MKLAAFIFAIIISPPLAYGQYARVTAWIPYTEADKQYVYYPEPILFVHGINDNDNTWGDTGLLGLGWAAIPALKNVFAHYALPETADNYIGSISNLNTRQEAYLHTFNYGDYPNKTIGLNEQSFEHIEWNAWADDMRHKSFTNTSLKSATTTKSITNYVRNATNPYIISCIVTNITQYKDPAYIQAPPNKDQWITLDKRINNKDAGIRQAYSLTPSDPNTWPKIVLVAHSMGGLVSHYYLCKCVETGRDCGVRRLVTLSSPHLGSYLANQMYFYNAIDADAMHIANGAKFMNCLQLTRVSSHNIEGFAQFPKAGALEDLTVDNEEGPKALICTNDLQTYFRTHEVPNIEYIFNSFTLPLVDGYRAFWFFRSGWKADVPSDGLVPIWSAAGKTNKCDQSIFFSCQDPPIDPVIFGPWDGLAHSAAATDQNSLFKSLFGVPYQWPDASTLVHSPALPNQPSYATTYGENQSFSKYLPPPIGSGTVNSDEPGIGQMFVLCTGSLTNPIVIPALDTWICDGTAYPRNTLLERSNLVDHTIIGSANATIRLLGTIGAKNHARTPFISATKETNNYYWAHDGNEYLPASVKLSFGFDSQPLYGAISISQCSTGMASRCLALLDPTCALTYQYGLFDQTIFNAHPRSGVPLYFFALGNNIASLNTPLVERGFDVPVDSASLVRVLCTINEREKSFGEPTRWTQNLTEWIDVPTTGVFKLNFVPTEQIDPNYINPFVDAFATQVPFTDWSYDPASRTITLNNPGSAPSCLMASYEAYLGGIEDFTVYQGEYRVVVPALTQNTLDALTGIPLTWNFIEQMQDACQYVSSGYVDHRQGDLSCLSAVPSWQTSDATASNFLFAAMANGQTGWRRQARCGTFSEPGQAQEGDIIGPWIFEDMQRALNLLRWIPVGGCFKPPDDPDEHNMKYALGTDTDLIAAEGSAEADWDDSDYWVNGYYIRAGTWVRRTDGGYQAAACRNYFYATTDHLRVGACDYDLYFPARAYTGEGTASLVEFDDNGDDITESEGIGARQRQSHYDGSGAVNLRIGSADLPFPEWPSKPPLAEEYDKGWELWMGTGFCFIFHAWDSFIWK